MIVYNFPHQINIFIGYQFESSYYQKERLVEKVRQCCKKASKSFSNKSDSKNTSLIVKFQDFHVEVGEMINSSIRTQIQNSDICIFEMSHNNPNVFYEAGFSIGLNKTVIYVSHDSTVRNVASDNLGVGFATYDNIDKIGNTLVIEIEKAITRFIKSKSVVDSLWNFTKGSTIAYLGDKKPVYTVGDFKALELIRANIKNHQNIKIGIEQEFEEHLSSNLIIIGGPKTNKFLDIAYGICEQKTYCIKEIKTLTTKNKWCIVKCNGEVYKTNFTREHTTNSKEKDYALVFLGRNPYKTNVKWFCFSGLTRISTLESIKCFLNEEELSVILEGIDYCPRYDYALVLEIGIFHDTSFGFQLVDFEKITPSILLKKDSLNS